MTRVPLDETVEPTDPAPDPAAVVQQRLRDPGGPATRREACRRENILLTGAVDLSGPWVYAHCAIQAALRRGGKRAGVKTSSLPEPSIFQAPGSTLPSFRPLGLRFRDTSVSATQHVR